MLANARLKDILKYYFHTKGAGSMNKNQLHTALAKEMSVKQATLTQMAVEDLEEV